MTEAYLHYLWKYKLFSHKDLITADGESLEVLDYGFHNHDSGPDFSEGKVKIGETTWVGHIEIHISSSDWLRHNHQIDKAYDNVVLHVVYNHDKEITTTSGSFIPTLELKNRVDISHYKEYEKFIFKDLPCGNLLSSVPEIIISSTMEQMMVERLIGKYEIIKRELEITHYNWEQVFFQFLAKSMGMKVNSQPMEELAKKIDVRIFSKLGNNLLAIESILFGQAGMLEEKMEDEYIDTLQKEFQFYKAKHNIVPMNKIHWKLSKLRPPNFPTLRISQLGLLLSQSDSLFNELILSDKNIEELVSTLSISITEGYWFSHYTFGTESKQVKKSMGKTLIHSILINTLAPFLYAYGKYKNEPIFIEKSIALLDSIPAEQNKITRLFSDKIEIESAGQSQGVINCYNGYCVSKKCLNCSIGIYILKNK